MQRLCWLLLSICPFCRVEAYALTGVNTAFNFGTISAPFPDLTLTNNTICVGYGLFDSSNYYIKATSSNSSSAAFQLTNTANTSYTLNYSVSWAGSSGSSPAFITLSSGQNSISSFTAQLLGTSTCGLLPPNATLQLQLLGANQMLAHPGTYSDTLTILIIAA